MSQLRKIKAMRRRKHALPPPKTYGWEYHNGRVIEALRPAKGRVEDPEDTYERALAELEVSDDGSERVVGTTQAAG